MAFLPLELTLRFLLPMIELWDLVTRLKTMTSWDAGPILEKGDEKPWPPWTAAAAVLCLKDVLKGREGPAGVLGLNKNTPTRDRIIAELKARPTLRA